MAQAPPPPAVVPNEASGVHVAHVVSVGSTDGAQQRVVLELEPPEAADRVYAWLPRYPEVNALDQVSFDARLEPASVDDSFGQYLARAGIAYSVRPRSFDLLGASDSPLAELERVRRTAADLLARAVPQPQSGLATGLLVGLRDQLARDVSSDFRAAGLSHIVAISGSHLALLAAIAGSMLGRLSRRRRSMAVLALIWGYSLLAGGGPAVFRASVMASVVIGARESGRAAQARGALALTAVAMLVADPSAIGDIGFQLSLAATAGLAGVERNLWRSPATKAAGAHACGACRRAWHVACRPTRDAAAGAAAFRSVIARLATRQPAGRAAGRSGHAFRRSRAGRFGCSIGRLAGPAGRAVRAGRIRLPRRSDRRRSHLRFVAAGQPFAAATP